MSELEFIGGITGTEPWWAPAMFYSLVIISLFALGYFNKKVVIDMIGQTEFIPEPPRPAPPEPTYLRDLPRKDFIALMCGLLLVSCVYGYSFYFTYFRPQPAYEMEVTFFEVVDQPWATRWDRIHTYGDWYFYLEGDWTWVQQNQTLIIEVRYKRDSSHVPSYYVNNWRYKNE